MGLSKKDDFVIEGGILKRFKTSLSVIQNLQ